MELQVTVCAEAELQVTEYFRCGISLVPYAMVRMTWERRARRARRPLGQSHLGGAIFTGDGTYWIFFLFSPLLSSCNTSTVL